MRFHALACDYDGTAAEYGHIDEPTVEALKRCAESGRKLILVTGRELEDLKGVCPHLDLFDWVVAENGAVLYRPENREETQLAKRPPEQFIQALEKRGVRPVSVGRVLVATWHPYEDIVLDVIREFGLELQVIFNKGAVMVLPSGINKATGLRAAADRLGLSLHNVVAIGDAENDHALLASCEMSAAVANAVPLLKQAADLATEGDHGAGVRQLIELLLKDDLASLEPRLARHHLLLGHRLDDGSEVRLPAYGTNFLIAGSSGAGKSTLATAFLERLMEKKYQLCVIDPEGDFEQFPGAVPIGSAQQPPSADMVVRLLEKPTENAVVNMIDIPLADRPAKFLTILSRIHELRALTGRPHWILVDEAHHLLPAAWEARSQAVPNFAQTGFITIEPDAVLAAALEQIDTVIAAGEAPEETLRRFAAAVGIADPGLRPTTLDRGQLVVWSRRSKEPPFVMAIEPGKTLRLRHKRKYAQGEIDPEHHFYFRGPDGKLKLRAQNLIMFLQMAEGVDDPTWLFHLRQGDISRWFREGIKDDELAEEAAKIEAEADLSAEESRARITALVEQRYTLPSSPLQWRAEAAEPPR